MLEKAQQIFIVGIGGIGVSGLARILHERGKTVTGSDVSSSELTSALALEGIRVFIGHRRENLAQETELLIYSSAVPEDNPERREAEARHILQMVYPQALGELAQGQKVIAIAGTNGKTTVTAMVARILEAAGLDPSAVVGSKVLDWDSNARSGAGEYLVVEADEYRRAFLNYQPEVAVITNIQEDHLDYYRDLRDIKKAFTEFVGKLKPGGTLVYNAEDDHTLEVAGQSQVKTVSFAVHRAAEVNEKNFRLPPLVVPGGFNRSNAFAAAAVAQVVGVPNSVIASALAKFRGTWRRFEKLGRVGETEIISDYAHHPEGVRVTLETAAGLYGGEKVLAVFQPHQHNRTKKLFQKFVEVFADTPVQNFIISEIFEVAGREEAQDQDISSNDLVREILARGKKVQYAPDLEHCEKLVRRNLRGFRAVIFLGAGDIYKVAERLAHG